MSGDDEEVRCETVAALKARIRRLQGELVAAERMRVDAERMAHEDFLTGLANRRYAEREIERAWALASRGTKCVVALADIDNFKAINDTHGHSVGDDVIIAVSRAVAESVRECDVAARWGGEEFLMLLIGCDHDGAHVMIERARKKIEARQVHGVSVTASFGVGVLDPRCHPRKCIDKADEALYHAKILGKNMVRYAKEPAE